MVKNKNFTRVILVLCCILLVSMSIVGCKSSSTDDKDANIVKSVDDLEGKKIGVQLGTTGDIYCSDYEGDEAGTVIERYNKGNDAVLALKQGKIDAVVIDSMPAEAFVEVNSDLKILDEEFANEDYAICISKKNQELKLKINDALQELSKNGELDKIKANYVGEENERGQYKYEAKDIDRPNGKLVVATNAAFKPYEYYENGNITGLDIDMMQAVCDILGMELKIEDMEFDSIISAVSSGKADCGASGMTVTEDRLKNIDFSDSYTNAKQVIIVKNSDASENNASFIDKLKQNFIEENRYEYILTGLKNTIIIAISAIIIGIIFGFIIAIICASHTMTGKLKIVNAFCKIYLTVVRGTPSVVQLLIIYFVVFASVDVSKILVAIIAFGLNSAAYVAEIVRSGIMSVDRGQFEAGRSLGMPYTKVMRKIILPQAIKNVLPALGNEFIVILKETSICGYVGFQDLTKSGDIIRSITYEPFIPLIAVALIYLILVMILQSGVNYLERRLRKNERK